MKKIPLTQGKFALVDDADYEKVAQFKWYADFDSWNWYAKRSLPKTNGTRKTIRLHHFLMGAIQVDHWDGDGLNNQRHNLRAATDSQNQANKGKLRGCSSLFKGVYWREDIQSWRARISVAGKRIQLGNFLHEEDAARAYDSAATKYFGEFARLNFISPVLKLTRANDRLRGQARW